MPFWKSEDNPMASKNVSGFWLLFSVNTGSLDFSPLDEMHVKKGDSRGFMFQF